MIITRISGGLGNQMFQYAMAKSMAKKNNDIFKLDTSFYPKQTLRKYELNLFNIDENIATKDECIGFRGKEKLIFRIKNKLGLNIKRPYSHTFENNLTLFDKEVYKKQGDIYLDGFWQNEDYFKNIKDEIIKDFIPKNNISLDAKKYLEHIKDNQSISIHIRRGDYVANAHTNSIHGICGIDYYKKAIKYIDKKVKNPIYYIFSDDMSWCKENFNFLKDKVFINNTKNTIEDLELMKNCKYNIIANSTFSWWGAWLNKNNAKIVITPKVWFASNNNINLALKEWIKI